MAELGGERVMRRRLLVESGEEEVAKWKEILNEAKTVEEIKVVEFDLSTAEEHDEYVIKIRIEKSKGTETCKGNATMDVNGMNIGYYVFHNDYSANNWEHVIKIDKPVKIVQFARSTNQLQFNSAQVYLNGNIGKESGTGKFKITFPTNYAGEVSVQVFAK